MQLRTRVQHGPALEELLSEFGVFVQGGIEQPFVGGNDDNEREEDYRAEQEAAD